MLMSLLPLAGWANDLKDCDISVPNVEFGTAAFPGAGIEIRYGSTLLTLGTDYEIVAGYFVNADDATPVMNGAVPAALNELGVGDYYVKFTGKGGYATTSAAKLFSVTGKLLAAGNITGAPLAAQTYTGSAITPATTGRLTDGLTTLVEGTHYTVAYSNNINAGTTATITYTGIGDYAGNISETFTINPKNLTAGMITQVELSEIYKGAAFTEFAVNIKDGSTPLVADKDFVLTVYDEEGLTTPVAPTNVKAAPNQYYYLGITNKPGANYNVAAKTKVGTFEITKAGLTVRALNQTMVYNASQDLPSSDEGVAYQLIGVQGTDVFGAPTLTVGNGSVGANNVGAHPITPSGYANGNYDYNYVGGTLTINKRPITIKAIDASKKYTQADEDATGYNKTWPTNGVAAKAKGYNGVEVWYTGDETKTITAIMSNPEEIKFFGEYVSNNNPKKYNAGIYVAKKDGTSDNKGEYPNALEVKYTKEDAAVLDNYDITLEAGKYSVTGGKMYITALNLSKNYGEADPSWTAVREDGVVENPNYRVDGISPDDLKDLKGVTLTCTHDESVDDYVINITASEIPTGYEDVVYVPGTFTIKQRPLKVLAHIQTLKKGDDAGNLDQTAYDIISTDPKEGLIDGDKASEVFSLTIAPAALPLNAAKVIPNAIIKADGSDVAKAANYDITFIPGKLIVIDPDMTIALNRPNKDVYKANPESDNAATVIATAAAAKFTQVQADDYNARLDDAVHIGDALTAANVDAYNTAAGTAKVAGYVLTAGDAAGIAAYNATLDGAVSTADQRPYAVTFGDFAMKAEKWYPIVLPFETSVREVSEAFGYAVVNILKKENTDPTKIAFKLYMGNIPANTPFVVKIYEDRNMNTVFFGDPTDPYFDGKLIVKSTKLEAEDDQGVKFIGSYSAKTDGFRANEAFFSVSAAKNDYYWGSDKNKTYMAPLGAYFQIPAGSPARTIVFEEPDGSTTAIEAVTTVNAAKKLEGWYTLNGMKLETAPTQKGIYIKDGKKVVLK